MKEKLHTAAADGRKLSKRFFIIISDSCQNPAKFSDIDERFSTEGPLDEGIKRNRAGQPSRLYKNFVHKVKGKSQEVIPIAKYNSLNIIVIKCNKI